MSSELHALRYLTPELESFWEWKDEGDVVSFRGGGTLAFREQLLAVLKPFADRPLPPLELVLLVMAACRDSWPEERKTLESQHSPLTKSARPILKQWWNTVFQSLERVQGLPQQMRSNPDAVATIVEIAFERYRFPAIPSEAVFQILLQPHWLRTWDISDAVITPFGVRTAGYSSLSQDLLKLTVDEVLTRTKTGLNQLPVIDRLMGQLQQLILMKEAHEVRTVRQLLDELRDDEEFRGLIRVVRMLSAVLTLPRDLSTPEELPQGGVSDITNRGPLDRLLLSELANDDDTLMTRVALNEALYYRRETPPAHPVRERVLLIDAGIRMWGLPRLCAAAVGLCLASQELSGGAVRVFRSSIDGVHPVDFTTREGLTEHLAALDCSAHPGELLEEWLDETVAFFSEKGRSPREGKAPAEPRSTHNVHPHSRLGGSLALPDTRHPVAARKATLPTTTDRILITGEDVLADPEFRQQLRASEVIPAFVVTVNRAGRVRLIRLKPVGEKVLRELWVDIEALSGAEKQPEKSLVDPTAENRLPAILRLRQLPLRMPYPMTKPELIVPYPRPGTDRVDVLQITRDRRLLLWDQTYRGGRQVTDQFPPGLFRWSGELTNNMTFVRSFAMVMVQQEGQIHLVQLRSNSDGSTAFQKVELNIWSEQDENWPILGIIAQQSTLLFVLRTSIVAVYTVTGERVASVEIPSGLHRAGGRYFTKYHVWLAASYANGQIQFDTLLDAKPFYMKGAKVLGIVGPPDNQVAVLSSGELLNWMTKSRRSVDPAGWNDGFITSVSSDGNQFVISTPRGNGKVIQHIRVTLGPPVIMTQLSYPYSLPFHDDRNLRPTDEALLRKLSYLASDQHLMLVSNKGRRLLLDVRPEKNGVMHLCDFKTDGHAHYRHTSPFVEIPSPPGVGYTLKQVTWTDGSRAVLDSRGMLHLQSSDQAIPELTLVLCEKHVSGWCSTGEVWGRDYFIDETVPGVRKTSPDQIMPILRQFLARLP